MSSQTEPTELQETAATPLVKTTPARLPVRQPEKGAIGIAFLVWLFGGGLGLALLVFILLKLF